MNNILEIVHDDNEKVVIKVNAKDPLTVAMNPWASANEEYYTITKGDSHVFTVIKTDGSTWSFFWGLGGHTLVSEDVEIMKKKVLRFLKDNNIDMGKYCYPYNW